MAVRHLTWYSDIERDFVAATADGPLGAFQPAVLATTLLECRLVDRLVAVEVERLRSALTKAGTGGSRSAILAVAGIGGMPRSCDQSTNLRPCKSYLASVLSERSLGLFIESSVQPLDHMNITRVARPEMVTY